MSAHWSMSVYTLGPRCGCPDVPCWGLSWHPQARSGQGRCTLRPTADHRPTATLFNRRLQVEGLYADMGREGVGASTIRNAANMLGAALSHACRLKLIPFNPAGAVSKPKEPAREMLFLTPEQVKILLAAAQDQRCYPLLVLALATGCRQGELLALTWEDIDLQKGSLTVRRSLAQTDHGFEVKEPKTAAGRRTIALPDLAVSVLTAHKAAMMRGGLLCAPVFCTRDGGYLMKPN